MQVKPKWLRRLHMAAHQGYPAVDCPLCKTAFSDPATRAFYDNLYGDGNATSAAISQSVQADA
jgi:hypothetical protein